MIQSSLTTFDDANDAYKEIIKTVLLNGELKGKRREIPFLTFTLTDLDKNILLFPFAQRNWPWILRECLDRIYGIENPGIAYRYSKQWENRIEESGLYSYHYSNRLNGQMQEALSKKIHGRDKIISVWQKSDYTLKGRQPCTILMQPIMEADNKMSLAIYMRNNDVINILPSDIFIHSTYFKYWATRYGIEYKNLYWVAAIAYYQKKRDTTGFASRLVNQWKSLYSANLISTRWTKEVLIDLGEEARLEHSWYYEPHLLQPPSYVKAVSRFQTDYIREWYKIMLLAYFKKIKAKDEFQEIQNSEWRTEFGHLKESIIL